MPTEQPQRTNVTRPTDVASAVARGLLLIGAFICAAALAIVLSVSKPELRQIYEGGLATAVLLAAALGAAALLARKGRVRASVALALGAMLVAAVLFALISQRGIHTIILGGVGTIVLVAGIVLGLRVAVAFAALCFAALAAMYVGEILGWMPQPDAIAAIPPLARLLSQAMLLAIGLLFAWTIGHIARASMSEATLSEQRFRSLLRLASDWYWEQDERLRFVDHSHDLVEATRRGIPAAGEIGKLRWELAGMDLSYGDWDAHRADLAARRPFSKFVTRRTNAAGRVLYSCISGEPIFDAGGRFCGYWGVGRDVTAEAEAQRAIEASERRFRALFERSPTALIINRNGRVLMVNEAAARLLGYPQPDAMIGMEMLGLNDLSSRDLGAERIAKLERMAVGESLPPAEFRLRRRDGEALSVQAWATRIEHVDGPANLTIYFDITERKRTESALQRSEAMLSHLFEAGVDAIAVSELLSGKIVLVNEGYAQLTGYPLEEARGRTAAELGIWAEPARREAFRQILSEQGRVRDFPMDLRRRDGADRSVLLSSAVFGLDGTDFAVTVARDVTQVEQERLQYDAILKNASVGIALTRDRAFLHANPQFEHIFGWEPGTLVGQPGSAVWHSPEEYAEIGRVAGPQLSQGEPVDFERQMARRDGSSVLCHLRGRVVDPLNPITGGTIWIAEDVTERRRAEQELARSQALLNGLFRTSPDFITLTDPATGRFELVNDGFTMLTGYARDEVLGRSVLDIGLWEYPEERRQLVDGVAGHGIVRNLPATFRTKDGRLLSVLITASSFDLGERSYLVGIARDVTQSERTRLEYEAIIRNASVGISFTRDRVFQHVNPRFAEMLGWTVEELVGQSGEVVWPSALDYAEIGRRYGPALAVGDGVDFEWQLHRRDGSRFWARVRAQALDPQNPSAGGTIWITEDITVQRGFERALAEAKEQAEAASHAKSAFLANTSHEIRTPLNGLLGLTRLALDPTTDTARQREYLQRILESAESLAAIISDILDLSKIEAGKLTLEAVTFDLRDLLAVLDGAYRELASAKGLAFKLCIENDVPRFVSGDPVRVRQIVSNFVSNALKFTAAGQIEIAARMMPAGRVRLAVTDTGIGVDAEQRARLFQPFTQVDASTTRRYGGTGLGLSICRQLAALMGGDVGVDSTPSSGSTFWADLTLPSAAPPAALAETAAEAADETGLIGLRVLLVEDNAINTLIAATMLRNWGVEVVEAVNGQEAVDIVDREAGRFDAVLMDVHMPVMGGHEATVTIRKRYGKEQLPIIALTAAALASEQEESLAVGMNDFISKPFDVARLRDTLLRAAAGRARE